MSIINGYSLIVIILYMSDFEYDYRQKAFINLSTLLRESDENSISNIVSWISKSIFAKDSFGKIIISRYILQLVRVRREKMDIAANILILVDQQINIKSEFVQFSLEFLDSEKDYAQPRILIFLLKIIEKGFFSSEEYKNLCVKLYQLWKIRSYEPVRLLFSHHFYKLFGLEPEEKEFSETNWEFFDQCIERRAYPNSIEDIIMRDDVDKLIELSALDPKFDWNMILNPPYFCDASQAYRCPLLSFAALFGANKCLRTIILNGADFNTVSRRKYTAGTIAAAGGNPESMRILHQAGFDVSGAAIMAASYQRPEIIEWIKTLEEKPQDRYSRQIIDGSVIGGYLELFLNEIAEGATTDKNILEFALRSCSIEIYESIVQYGLCPIKWTELTEYASKKYVSATMFRLLKMENSIETMLNIIINQQAAKLECIYPDAKKRYQYLISGFPEIPVEFLISFKEDGYPLSKTEIAMLSSIEPKFVEE